MLSKRFMFKYNKAKKTTYELLDGEDAGPLELFIQWFIIVLVIANVLAVVAGSVDSIEQDFGNVLLVFEKISMALFSIEYMLRLWSCTADPQWKHPIKGRIRYILTGMALIDLFAILPGFLPILFHHADMRFLRIVRLIRILRILKLGRYSESVQMLGRIIKRKREELYVTLFVAVVIMLLSASMLYTVEHDIQPKVFGSIPQAMWWAVVTMTTVGYGDIYPVTAIGKILASICTLLGIALFAMPTAILASGFSEELNARKTPQVCPHCGKKLNTKKEQTLLNDA